MYFSIIISTFNRPNFIYDLIFSISIQKTDKAFEIIIIEGGTLESFAAISKIAATFPLLTIKIFHFKNCSLGQSRNFGALNASGFWCLFSDDDDVWSPIKLSELDKFIEDYDVLSHGYLASKNPSHDQFNRLDFLGRPIELSISSLAQNAYGNRYGGGSSLCARTNVVQVVRFNEKMKSCEDIEWILRCLFSGLRLGFIPIPLVIYRIHHNRMTGNILKNIQWEIFLARWLLIIGLGSLIGSVMKLIRLSARFTLRR
jgi:glycosyltransferase involved in cell wall biosynthesis